MPGRRRRRSSTPPDDDYVPPSDDSIEVKPRPSRGRAFLEVGFYDERLTGDEDAAFVANPNADDSDDQMAEASLPTSSRRTARRTSSSPALRTARRGQLLQRPNSLANLRSGPASGAAHEAVPTTPLRSTFEARPLKKIKSVSTLQGPDKTDSRPSSSMPTTESAQGAAVIGQRRRTEATSAAPRPPSLRRDDPRGTQRRIVIDIDSSDDGLGHPVARGAGFDPDDEEAESDGSDGDDWVDDAEVDFHDASQGSTSTVSVQPIPSVHDTVAALEAALPDLDLTTFFIQCSAKAGGENVGPSLDRPFRVLYDANRRSVLDTYRQAGESIGDDDLIDYSGSADDVVGLFLHWPPKPDPPHIKYEHTLDPTCPTTRLLDDKKIGPSFGIDLYHLINRYLHKVTGAVDPNIKRSGGNGQVATGEAEVQARARTGGMIPSAAEGCKRVFREAVTRRAISTTLNVVFGAPAREAVDEALQEMEGRDGVVVHRLNIAEEVRPLDGKGAAYKDPHLRIAIVLREAIPTSLFAFVDHPSRVLFLGNTHLSLADYSRARSVDRAIQFVASLNGHEVPALFADSISALARPLPRDSAAPDRRHRISIIDEARRQELEQLSTGRIKAPKAFDELDEEVKRVLRSVDMSRATVPRDRKDGEAPSLIRDAQSELRRRNHRKGVDRPGSRGLKQGDKLSQESKDYIRKKTKEGNAKKDLEEPGWREQASAKTSATWDLKRLARLEKESLGRNATGSESEGSDNTQTGSTRPKRPTKPPKKTPKKSTANLTKESRAGMAVGGKKCHATLAERRRRHNALGYTDCEHCDVRFKDLRELVPHRRKYHAGEERKAHAKEQAMCNAKRRAAAAQAHRPAASPNTTTTASSPVASTSRLPTAPTSRGPAAFSLYDDDYGDWTDSE